MPLDVEGARLLFQVVADCYERRSPVITTNIEFSKWGTVLADDKLAAAMIDRIVHHGRLVEFTGTSRREEGSLDGADRRRGMVPAALVPEREAAFRDIGELCTAIGCAVCTASVYDLGYVPVEIAEKGGEALKIPF